jgi:tryptophan synthase beta subunit
VGGGSNAAGTYYHYLDNEEVNIIAVEAAGLFALLCLEGATIDATLWATLFCCIHKILQRSTVKLQATKI